MSAAAAGRQHGAPGRHNSPTPVLIGHFHKGLVLFEGVALPWALWGIGRAARQPGLAAHVIGATRGAQGLHLLRRKVALVDLLQEGGGGVGGW